MKITEKMRHELHEGFCKAANPRAYIDEQAAAYGCDRQVIREAIGLRTPDPTRVALPDGEWDNDDLFPGGDGAKGATLQSAAPTAPLEGEPKKRVGHPRIDPSIRDAAVKAMRGGMTLREASERFKVTKATLQLWRGAAGLVKPYGKRTKKP